MFLTCRYFLLQVEAWFEQTMKEKRGLLIKKMGEDGACMFRAVADQVYGDQEMHSLVRQNCIDYMVIIRLVRNN